MSVRQNNWNKILEIYDYNNKTFFCRQTEGFGQLWLQKEADLFFYYFFKGKKEKESERRSNPAKESIPDNTVNPNKMTERLLNSHSSDVNVSKKVLAS